MNRDSSAEKLLNGHLQNPGDGDQFVIEDRPLAAFDLRDLRLIELDPQTREAARHVLLCNLRHCCLPHAEDVLAGDIATFGSQGALDGGPILVLFAAGIILHGTKMSVAILRPKQNRPLTVLCADDHTLIGEALTKVFTTAGYMVERADDGEAALAKAIADLDRFDVVITDHEMPRKDGLDLVAGLRSAQFGGRIIVYSAALPPEVEARYRAFSVDAIVVKSPEAERLLAIVEAFHGER